MQTAASTALHKGDNGSINLDTAAKNDQQINLLDMSDSNEGV